MQDYCRKPSLITSFVSAWRQRCRNPYVTSRLPWFCVVVSCLPFWLSAILCSSPSFPLCLCTLGWVLAWDSPPSTRLQVPTQSKFPIVTQPWSLLTSKRVLRPSVLVLGGVIGIGVPGAVRGIVLQWMWGWSSIPPYLQTMPWATSSPSLWIGARAQTPSGSSSPGQSPALSQLPDLPQLQSVLLLLSGPRLHPRPSLLLGPSLLCGLCPGPSLLCGLRPGPRPRARLKPRSHLKPRQAILSPCSPAWSSTSFHPVSWCNWVLVCPCFLPPSLLLLPSRVSSSGPSSVRSLEGGYCYAPSALVPLCGC